MKLNTELTKTLLQMAAQTTLDKITNGTLSAGQNTPGTGAMDTAAAAAPDLTGEPTPTRQRSGADSKPQESLYDGFKGIGTQVAAAVAESLSSQIDKSVEKALGKAELAVENQRVAALREMQAVLEVERTSAVEELRKTAASISNRIIASAAFLGGSLLMVAAALILHK